MLMNNHKMLHGREVILEITHWRRGRVIPLLKQAERSSSQLKMMSTIAVSSRNSQAWLHRVHTKAMFLMTITSSLRINDSRALLKIQRERVMVMMLLQS
ncbi:hypothetical protein DY000_02011323 [Brassica cretica]|uniref:Uncharacterized protein n=1 Tax=Brassica cretica TaxID=69181 RepID=A0ABQ7D3T0_BRACR|nr:hypothetical protein DY000_02011323 [Brassica cretica]